MSANIISKTAFAIVATAGLSLTAYAGNGSSRYGGPSVYDYESGGNCSASACGYQGAVQKTQRYQQAPVAAPAASARYGTAVNHGMQVSPGVVYVDCARMGTCAPQPQVYQQPVYQAPQPSYTQQSYSQQSYTAPAALPASCPTGTTAQPDGTCMQSSYSSSTSYSSTPSYSSSSVTSSYSGESVPCPAGTSKQSDGSCLQGSGSSYSSGTSYSSGSSYGSSSSYSSAASTPVNCPAGTTAQSDGTCMEGGSVSSYAGGTATIYSGDASTSSSYGGYASDGSYSANSYLPIRK